ncbi:MAG: ATP-dependent DNA helicase PcrA [Candidatus Yonathbacteria bacterium CG_4_10_14_3_um_filter_47_65]|uniref:DNA 3'-5' helicase n=1 Tax=Candidatus Yonathbacteria bacterium CG_4_9_14_0_8_um_filter_46_47 TaxID=1975106 RepID=A0A2M8D5Q1_9BACT|nr:MAG: ATP-dependent DNA helicase PcrA [Candidatus Yonathbacteria bacterium CG23_combo_of_CG06-09_8_20_14_all_46_18]PIQ32906.1 MAG: ATP-dependent DNA helicase PcrA [Candidatus Yonathbacteria bacterium CG17_big_fil_post_rev_8_21_14_2_50_46_19]PIX55979.1 MAG: ATP-dependent DNA helicase PcrA [Candidatus Yonathbacteria bacterium CG_4_10_14_3_um_filter_47_65]PIY57328.1 MAG: ATP-dependent DNA helicase PcrA [Candidatus Yonathbacteria bacterium CG_4_10_14_0_8_um_filter_47_645]PJB81905.1 MAG: ATP-depen
MNHLDGLNERQRAAALHKDGPLLIIAGAGTGKTKTLTHRIMNLVKEGVPPMEILAITFTNKAANEMAVRVRTLLGTGTTRHFPLQSTRSNAPFIGTFHSLGAFIMRESGEAIGMPRAFSILDKRESLSLVKEAIKERGIDPKQFVPERISTIISKNKGELISVEEYAAGAGNNYFPAILSTIWLAYEKKLSEHKAVDFDDLIAKTVTLLRKNETARHYQNKWKYVHIDEYQDTNTAQYELARILAAAGNICVVGDADQNIYSWRGAKIRNILNFEKDYPGTTTVLLEENYRSTRTILAAANDVIKKNKHRKEKNLFTKNTDGEKITLYEGYDEGDESLFVARKIAELVRGGTVPKDIAVLYRANFQSRVLEEALIEHSLPYQILGIKFFERKEVKDVLAFIRAARNPDNTIDIKRVINVPPRGIGKITIERTLSGNKDKLSPALREKVARFETLLTALREASTKLKPSEFIKFVIKESGMEKYFATGTEDDKERLENARELATLAVKYDVLPVEEGVENLLADAALVSDQDSLENGGNAVRLMTVHASKGLEFPYVFITGMEQDLFPHKKIGESFVSEEEGEEERRLFYVALTRAEKKIFLSYASFRTIFGSRQVNAPSEFITDIDETLIEPDQGAGYADTATVYLE